MIGKKSKNDGKRPTSSGFFIILIAILLSIYAFQTFTKEGKAKVSFAYQLEHLVNLDLVEPGSLVKIAQNEKLVSFLGTFRKEETQATKDRFEYLSVLQRQHELSQEKIRLKEELADQKEKIMRSAEWFFRITNLPIPKEGFLIVPFIYDTGDENHSIMLTSAQKAETINVEDFGNQLRTSFTQEPLSKEKFSELRNSFLTLLQYFQSTKLGIGNSQLKQEIKDLVLKISKSDPNLENEKENFLFVYDQLKKIIQTILTEKDQVLFTDLRSVRNYVELLSRNANLNQELDTNTPILVQARTHVRNVEWFFNNEELSTKALEHQDFDIFSNWFSQAKIEKENFSSNRALSFKVPSQTLSLVLQKKFQSQEASPSLLGYLPMVLMGLFALFLIYFLFMRQMKGGVNSSAFNFGKSPARLLTKESNHFSFKDVAGADEAKEELQEVVEFLKDPFKFTSLGARIPKGVLLIGPPGTGKTLIAKAVAGEADRPFFSISGSDFVEMFVGVGASRIRDLFDQAKKQAPCIIFMDEIDAVGRQRGAGIGGGHDEREQTLNQLLVEMDGFDTKEGVILMAATNRPDILDRALLRPGRFDRTVMLSLPDVKGRYDILKVHARRIKIDPSIDLMDVARLTPGASGADLENILNEAALLAARHGRTAVTKTEVTEACDKVRFGKERRSLEIDQEEKRSTAFHESGHAIVGLNLKYVDPVDKVTIVPRGFALGATYVMPKKNRLGFWKKEAEDQLAFFMGGRAAEELFIHDMSSGAQQDISQATKLARAMVCEWGMSDLGLVTFDERKEGGEYLGLTSFFEKNYSDETAKQIDFEVSKLLENAHRRACEIVTKEKERIELMTDMLMEFETLDKVDVQEIMEGKGKEDFLKNKKERLEKADSLQKNVIPPPPPIKNQENRQKPTKDGIPLPNEG